MLPTTPDSATCPTGCLKTIEALREKIEVLTAVFEERLTELEKQIREINANPQK
jgi:hypothetical protein